MKRVKAAVYIWILPLLVIAVSLQAGEQKGDAGGGRFKDAPSGRHFFRVKLPPACRLDSARRLQFRDQGVVMDLYSRGFGQGDAVYVEISADEQSGKSVSVKKLVYGGQDVPVSERSWGYRGIFAIHPESTPGDREIVCTCSVGWSRREIRARFTIERTDFMFKRKALDLGKYSDVEYQQKPENIQFIKECAEKKKEAFARRSDDMLSEMWSHPRDLHYVTSPFWSKRTYMQYKIRNGKKIFLKNKIKVHQGLDLRGEEGSPLFVMGDGEVALAETLFYEGNMLIVDHGNSMFTYYMHLNSISVKKGDRVRAGDLVGTVGSTGISTASHLHVSCLIRGTQVDPMSLLPLPVRD